MALWRLISRASAERQVYISFACENNRLDGIFTTKSEISAACLDPNLQERFCKLITTDKSADQFEAVERKLRD